MQKLQFGWQPIPCVGCSMDNVVIDNNCYGGQLGHLITHIELISHKLIYNDILLCYVHFPTGHGHK